MTAELFFDLFRDGRWIGMAKGVDEFDARRMAARCLPELHGKFSLVRYHARQHVENCRASGGNTPDPAGEDSDDRAKRMDAEVRTATALLAEKQPLTGCVSFVQRKLHLSYGAARGIIKEMERRGILGPAGAKDEPRWLDVTALDRSAQEIFLSELNK